MLPDPVRQALALNDSLPSLWPEFAPGAYPVALFDGTSTWLVRHPHPPREFKPTGQPGLFVMTGRHPKVLANYAAELGGKITVSIMCWENAWPPPADLAALIAHEAFHAFQIERAQHWFPDMLDLYDYPFGDAEPLAWRRLETAALRRALDAAEQAAIDVQAWRTEQARLRAEYLARPGWSLRLVAETAPLRFNGGDPSNVQFIGEGELLHTRYLAFGNQYGEAELLD